MRQNPAIPSTPSRRRYERSSCEIPAAVSAASRQGRLDPRAVEMTFNAPRDYSAHLEHHRNFLQRRSHAQAVLRRLGVRVADCRSVPADQYESRGRPACKWDPDANGRKLIARFRGRSRDHPTIGGAESVRATRDSADQTAGAVACSWWISCRLQTRIGSRCCERPPPPPLWRRSSS